MNPPLTPPHKYPPRRLGLLVSSGEYADQILAILASASAKGIELRVHLTGKGVMLARMACFPRLRAQGRVFVCQESARIHGIEEALADLDPPVLLPRRQLVDLLTACDRHLML